MGVDAGVRPAGRIRGRRDRRCPGPGVWTHWCLRAVYVGATVHSVFRFPFSCERLSPSLNLSLGPSPERGSGKRSHIPPLRAALRRSFPVLVAAALLRCLLDVIPAKGRRPGRAFRRQDGGCLGRKACGVPGDVRTRSRLVCRILALFLPAQSGSADSGPKGRSPTGVRSGHVRVHGLPPARERRSGFSQDSGAQRPEAIRRNARRRGSRDARLQGGQRSDARPSVVAGYRRGSRPIALHPRESRKSRRLARPESSGPAAALAYSLRTRKRRPLILPASSRCSALSACARATAT